MNMGSVKVTEELRESWNKELTVQTALGTISQDPYYGDGVPNVFKVKYVTSYDGAEAPATRMCPRYTSVRALHAHHAVSIVLGMNKPLMNRFEYLTLQCGNVKWHSERGWNILVDGWDDV